MAQDRVEAVERALTIMDVFNAEHPPLGLPELAKATGFYKSTLLRLLGSLERFDYVKRGNDGLWRLGMRPVELALRHSPSQQLAALVQPALDQLAETSGETAALLVRGKTDVYCRLSALPSAALHHALHPGDHWQANGHTPCPELPSGFMEYLELSAEAGAPQQWLSLSGPAGRLSCAEARQALLVAKQALIHTLPLPGLKL
ncbi:IclR family transcriptional regulator [Halomonas halocynthiae]|uniref:IclR family transcriptional regulator n=1 Tax=Halomonas halocynthiae TaxID=176290 RepID=UPI0004066426|nr:helix-turn-helix domain-containing protein [Halomonas halocynthiae]